MKTIVLLVLILAAIIGPVTQNGKANLITVLSVLPLVAFGLILLFKAFGGKTTIIK